MVSMSQSYASVKLRKAVLQSKRFMRIANEYGLPPMCGSGSAANRKSCNTLNNHNRNALLLMASKGVKASPTGP